LDQETVRELAVTERIVFVGTLGKVAVEARTEIEEKTLL
jgi:hypothetical protein